MNSIRPMAPNKQDVVAEPDTGRGAGSRGSAASRSGVGLEGDMVIHDEKDA